MSNHTPSFLGPAATAEPRELRRRSRIVLGTALALAVTCGPRFAHAGPSPEPLDIGAGERLLVIAPHPDDEALATAGLVQRVLEKGGHARIVLITAGDGYVDAVRRITPETHPVPSEFIAYGERRLAEAAKSALELGGGRVDLDVLGFPDGGLKALLDEHWSQHSPERSPTTGASDPPYDEALDPSIPYSGANLRAQLERILDETQPTIVCLPDPIDIHPDHSAAGIFTLLAAEDWARHRAGHSAGPRAAPRLVGYLVHWPNWPAGWAERAPTLGEDAATRIEIPAHLPERGGVAITEIELTAAEVGVKRAALSRYASQQEIVPGFLNAFVRKNELFTVLSEREAQQVVAQVPWAAPTRAAEPTRHARRPSVPGEDVRAR